MKSNEEKQAENIKDVLENGPGLRKSHHQWIVAKDSKLGRVLKGGLGGSGVGQMWFTADEHDQQGEGYSEAPERDSFMGWGTWEEWMLKERKWTIVDEEGKVIHGNGQHLIANILRENAVLRAAQNKE